MSILKNISLKLPKNYDKLLHACILILLVFGTIMIASTSVGESNTSSKVVYMIILKQLVFMVVSYFMMTYFARNFVKFLAKEVKVKQNAKENSKRKNVYRGIFRGVGIGIGVALIITLFTAGVKGSKAWIPLGFMSLQPSEFAKVYMIVLLGIIINDYGLKKVKFLQYMKEPLLFFSMVCIILLLQPDMGTLLIFCCITGFCLLIPSNIALKKVRAIILICFSLLIAGFAFVSSDLGLSMLEKTNLGYKLGRIQSAADPFVDIFGEGYNLVYSIYAIANGGMSGLGLGGSEQKYGYLPEAQSDFIFSVTIEELGVFGLSIIVICYGIILYKLFYYAIKTKSEGFKVILIGCALYLSIHFIFNVGGVSGLIPLTGIPLLFISSGGSSLLAIMILIGICQSIIGLTKGQMSRLEEKVIK